MRRKLAGAALAAVILSTPAHAATFVKYTFEGEGTGTIYDVFDLPFGSPAILTVTGTLIFDSKSVVSYPNNRELLRIVSGDVLTITSLLVGKGTVYNNSFVFNFTPGTLSGELPMQLGDENQIGGSFNYNNAGTIWGFFGTGSLYNFKAELAPDAASDLVSLSVTAVPVSVSAVPEPASWAMFILGFGVIGGAMRSATRNQKVSVSFA